MVAFVLCWSKLKADSDKACGMKIALFHSLAKNISGGLTRPIGSALSAP